MRGGLLCGVSLEAMEAPTSDKAWERFAKVVYAALRLAHFTLTHQGAPHDNGPQTTD